MDIGVGPHSRRDDASPHGGTQAISAPARLAVHSSPRPSQGAVLEAYIHHILFLASHGVRLYLWLRLRFAVAEGGILPWLTVRRGKPLSTLGSASSQAELEELIKGALKEYGRLLLWDLDAMERGKPQLDLYKRFEGKGLWVDAGVSSVDAIIDVIVAGADVAVLNLRTLPRLNILHEAGDMTDRLALCVEEGEEVLSWDRRLRGLRPLELFKEAMAAGISRGVYLRHGGLIERPTWAGSLSGVDLYVGPVEATGRKPSVEGAVVDLYGLI